MRNTNLKQHEWCIYEEICSDNCTKCPVHHEGPNPNKQSGIIPTTEEKNIMAKKIKKAAKKPQVIKVKKTAKKK